MPILVIYMVGSKHNLKALLQQLLDNQPAISSLHLFGSRAYGTRSTRSDCDILVAASPCEHIKAGDLRDFALTQCSALDFFVVIGGHATSVMNDSFLYADSFDQLIQRLDAVLLWDKSNGFSENLPFDWVFETSSSVEFHPSNLPNLAISELTWHTVSKRAEEAGLPINPYIGNTIEVAAATIVDVAKRMALRANEIGQNGQAKNGWTVNLQSEYDCQNLFYTVVRPWISGIGREEVTIRFDDQDKIADFNLFQSQLIIEMKFIDTEQKKRDIVKTLDGLARFYSLNASIRVLLFIIFVKPNVSVDSERWAQQFTFLRRTPQVITTVIEVP
jgi:hypothetical protein